MRRYTIPQLKLGPGLKISARIMAISWKTRPMAMVAYFTGALLETGSFILSIYANAQLAGSLARYFTGQSTSNIWFWLAIDIVAGLGIAGGMLIMSMSKDLIYFRMVQWATKTYLTTLCRLDINSFYDGTTRNKINKAQNGYNWQISNFNETTLDLIYGIIRFIATAIVVAQIAWWLIPLIALFLLPSFFAEQRRSKVKWYVWDTKGDNRHVFWGLESIIRQAKYQMELRSSQTRDYVLNKIDSMNQHFYITQEQQFKRISRFVIPAKLVEVAGTTIGAIVVLLQFLAGTITLERYFFLSGALLRLGSSLSSIFGTLSRMQEPLLFTENFLSLIDIKTNIQDVPNANVITVSKNEVPKIEFINVSFTYPGQTSPVFSNLSFNIEPGEHLALVGQNGAGKSTIIKLLLRFYQPTEGTILVNNQDLKQISIESWYSQLATLFQDFIEYPFSIAENIEISRPERKNDIANLKTAASYSDVDGFVNNYKHGWDTVLDNSFEKGTEPSGGQWQRVALARAFYRDANILILDEPTASIDALAEYTIFNKIFEHYSKKTAIIVSHRFSTVRRAHRIIVLDKGNIIEQGSHKKLIANKGMYYEMFTKQAEGYQ